MILPKSPTKKQSRRCKSRNFTDLAAPDRTMPLQGGINDPGMSKRALYPMFEGSESPEAMLMEEDGVDQQQQHVEKKRRLSVEQVKSLERYFEVENKLEPERKMQLARELGLQPRQVAVWFQNRRARWKTKQLEKDYDALKASLDTLRTDYDALLSEKRRLESEVQRLLKSGSGTVSDGASLEAEDASGTAQKSQNNVLKIKVEAERDPDMTSATTPGAKNSSISDDDSEILDEESPHHPAKNIKDVAMVSDQHQCSFSVHPDVLELGSGCHDMVEEDRLFPIHAYYSSASSSCSRTKLEDFPYDGTDGTGDGNGTGTGTGGGFMSLEEDQDQGWWEWS